MAIIQVAYDIPEKFSGLLVGELTRFGSVVRDHGGIVGHLNEVPIPKQNYDIDEFNIAKIIKEHKAIAIGLGVVTIMAVAGGIVLKTINSRKNKMNTEHEIPKCVAEFNGALYVYLEAVRDGNLDMDIITALITYLNEIKENYDSGKINIDFSTGQLNTLIDLIVGYTKKLAEANYVELNEFEEIASGFTGNTIINLQRYLEVQKQIFETA